jgi:hypothetical protein
MVRSGNTLGGDDIEAHATMSDSGDRDMLRVKTGAHDTTFDVSPVKVSNAENFEPFGQSIVVPFASGQSDKVL